MEYEKLKSIKEKYVSIISLKDKQIDFYKKESEKFKDELTKKNIDLKCIYLLISTIEDNELRFNLLNDYKENNFGRLLFKLIKSNEIKTLEIRNLEKEKNFKNFFDLIIERILKILEIIVAIIAIIGFYNLKM